MAEGQKTRKVGTGMKPRGNAGKTNKQEPKVTTEEPTNEGQPESIIKPVLDQIAATETGGSLATENEPKTEPESASKVSEPAGENEAVETDSKAEAEELGALMGSTPTIIRPGSNVPVAEKTVLLCAHDNPVGDCQICEDFNKAESRPTIDVSSDGAVVGPVKLSNGDEMYTVTVPEEYIEAVKQWAESDGVPVERWLSDRIYEYIVGYGNPPVGR